VTWNKKDSVAVKELDDQHEALIDFLKTFLSGTSMNKTRSMRNG
jgi:hemerythrin